MLPSKQSPRNKPPVSVAVAYGLMLFTVVTFASAFAGIRYMLDRLDVGSFTTLRLAIAVMGMLALGFAFRVGLPPRTSLRRLIAAGLCGFSIYHLLLNFGAARITAGQAAFLTATVPLWTAFGAWRFLGESVNLRHALGLLVSLGGIGWMSLDRSDLDVPIGSLFVVGAAMFAAANIVLQKVELEHHDAVSVTVWVTVIGALPVTLALPFFGADLGVLDATGWGVALYLGIVPMVIGYLLSTVALRALPAYRTSQMLLLIPPIAASIAWLTLGEVPAPRTLTGGAIVLLGVALTMRRRRRAEPTPQLPR